MERQDYLDQEDAELDALISQAGTNDLERTLFGSETRQIIKRVTSTNEENASNLLRMRTITESYNT